MFNTQEFINELSAMSKLSDRYNVVTLICCSDFRHVEKKTILMDDANTQSDCIAYSIPNDRDIIGEIVDEYNKKMHIDVPAELREDLVDRFIGLFYGTINNGNSLVFIPSPIDIIIIDAVMAMKKNHYEEIMAREKEESQDPFAEDDIK